MPVVRAWRAERGARRYFQSAPIGPLEWLGVATASTFAYGVVGIEKRLRRGAPRVPAE